MNHILSGKKFGENNLVGENSCHLKKFYYSLFPWTICEFSHFSPRLNIFNIRRNHQDIIKDEKKLVKLVEKVWSAKLLIRCRKAGGIKIDRGKF